MEAVAITGSLLAIIQIANTSAQLISRVTRATRNVQSNMYKELYWRLFAEREAMTTLIATIDTSGQPLSPENVKTFSNLLPELYDLHSRMERALSRLLPSKGTTTMRLIAHRIKFENGGFEDMKQTMATIESMTRALKILGETLPSYTPRSGQQSSSAPSDPPTRIVTEPRSFHRSRSDVNVEEEVDSPSSLRQIEPPITIASLCRLCEEAMLELSTDSSLQRKGISEMLARLELWSYGVLHTKDRPLDMLLKVDVERYKAIRVFLTKTFVNMGVALVTVFRTLQSANVDDGLPRFSKSRTRLLAALGGREFLDYAIARWNVLSERDEGDDEEEEEPGAVKTVESSTAQPPQEIARSEDQDEAVRSKVLTSHASEHTEAMLDSALTDFQNALESLFSITPSIRSMRQSYRLDLESAMDESAVLTSSTSITSERQGPLPQSGEQKEALRLRVVSKDKAAQSFMMEESARLAKLLENALRNDEAEAAKSDNPEASKEMRVLSPVMKKYRLELERFQDNATPLLPEKVNAVMELNRTLRDTIDAVMSSKDEEGLDLAVWKGQSGQGTDKILDQALERIGNNISILS